MKRLADLADEHFVPLGDGKSRNRIDRSRMTDS
jgi:hypothetical protein